MDIRSLLIFGVVGLAVFLVLMVVVLSRGRVCNGPATVGNNNESDYLKFSSDMFPNSYRCIVIEAPLVAGNATPATVLRDHWFRVLWCFFALFVSFNLFAQVYTLPFPTVPTVLSNLWQFGVQDVRFFIICHVKCAQTVWMRMPCCDQSDNNLYSGCAVYRSESCV